jgi:hypothetical protein
MHLNLHVEARNAAATSSRTSLELTVSHAISLNPVNFHPTFQKEKSSRSMRDRRGDFGGNKRLGHREAPIMNHATSVSGVAGISWRRESIG